MAVIPLSFIDAVEQALLPVLRVSRSCDEVKVLLGQGSIEGLPARDPPSTFAGFRGVGLTPGRS
jgi:hypothetical protein